LLGSLHQVYEKVFPSSRAVFNQFCVPREKRGLGASITCPNRFIDDCRDHGFISQSVTLFSVLYASLMYCGGELPWTG
jgi:hypothetical protein